MQTGSPLLSPTQEQGWGFGGSSWDSQDALVFSGETSAHSGERFLEDYFAIPLAQLLFGNSNDIW